MSQEDKMFMQLVSNSVKLHEGHYSIGLPLKDADVAFPNNRCLAEQRAISLKRKLLRNSQFYEDYKTFMAETLRKGLAVQIPSEEEQKRTNEGRKWYIAHHGVYHPKKDSN